MVAPGTSVSGLGAILVTFAATLVLPVPEAVGLGVLLTVVLYVMSSATDVTVRELVPLGDGRFSESDRAQRLPSDAVTVLQVYGSLFFAGARTRADALPNR